LTVVEKYILAAIVGNESIASFTIQKPYHAV
jgi:hypothetical protein